MKHRVLSLYFLLFEIRDKNLYYLIPKDFIPFKPLMVGCNEILVMLILSLLSNT